MAPTFLPFGDVAVYLSKSSSFPANDVHCSHSLQCSVWVGGSSSTSHQDDKGTTNNNSAVRVLQYYSFVDSPPLQFPLLKRLLRAILLQTKTRESSLGAAVVHVAADSKMPFRVVQSVLDELATILVVSTSEEENEEGDTNSQTSSNAAAAVLETKIEYLPKFSTSSSPSKLLERVDLDIARRVTPTSARQARTDPTLISTPLRLALALYWQHCSSSCPATHHDDDIKLLETLEPGSLLQGSFLEMDATAAATLHLWPPTHAAASAGSSSNNTTSLYGILGQPLQTDMGRCLLAHWLRQPLSELVQIQERQTAVAALVRDSVGANAIREALRWNINVDNLAHKLGQYDISATETAAAATESVGEEASSKLLLGSSRSALQALYQLYLVSEHRLPLLVERLEAFQAGQDLSSNTSTGKSELLQQLVLELQATAQQLHPRATDLANAVLDLDAAPTEFLVRPSFLPELQDVANELVDLDGQIESCHADMNAEWQHVKGMTTTSSSMVVRLERSSSDDQEYQFRLPDTNDTKLLESIPTVQIGRILKNGVSFTTKALRQFSTQRKDLLTEYTRHQTQVVRDAMAVAASYRPVLERLSSLVASVDVLVAMAHVASYSSAGPYCRPVLTDCNAGTPMDISTETRTATGAGAAGLQLEQARHACVELQEHVEFIPNDVELIYGQSSFLLVTGPNMGGKSTYLRSMGSIVAMAQVGSFVPCTTASINICHHILTRVGAGDLQERGISTFMAEMLESSAILRRATNRSLILIDELGRGTSTMDGYGLARAISEYIVERIGSLVCFTTHFHELTALEQSYPQVKNCHVSAVRGSHGLTFLYQVKPGPCLESFGIQVAETAGVPRAVIADAKLKAKELENFEYRNHSKKPASLMLPKDKVAMNLDDDCMSTKDEAFLKRLRSLPVSEIIAGSKTDDEKRSALLRALGIGTGRVL